MKSSALLKTPIRDYFFALTFYKEIGVTLKVGQ